MDNFLYLDDFPERELLIAIQSPLRVYQLAYMFNKKLQTRLVCRNQPQKKTYDTWLYLWEKETGECWYLLQNKKVINQEDSFEDWILPEMYKFDYFLVITDFVEDQVEKSLATLLKNMPEITFLHVFQRTDLKKKSRNKLLF